METATTSPAFTSEQQAWIKGFVAGLASCGAVQYRGGTLPSPSGGHGSGIHSKDHPYKSPLLVNRRLNGVGSEKETRHFEFNLEGSGLTYDVGDALGVCPTIQSDYVEDFLKAAGWSGEEIVPIPDGGTAPLRTALTHHYESKKIPRTVVDAFAERTTDARFKEMVKAGADNPELSKYLWGRETIDLFLEQKSVKFKPEEYVKLLKKLVPRLYSIASSIKAHPQQVHLTVAIVRYEAFGRKRKGACSNYLADSAVNSPIPVFMHHNKNFRLPASSDTPLIMVGPGTGIAPFRAFIEERKVTGAKGKNWLFFGDQRRALDFLYQDEFEGMVKEGTLNKLDLAFSRDQAQKVYVQNRMMEASAELFKWLQDGAAFYVCGDASRMAKDVDEALHKIAEKEGGMTPEAAKAYIQKLKSDKRYQRDVY